MLSDSEHRASLRLLGQFSLRIGGEERSNALVYDRVRILLATLALAQGEAVPRHELAASIWPQEPVSTGRTRLRHALHTLRGALSSLQDPLRIDASVVALRADALEIDVLTFLNEGSALCGPEEAARLSAYGGPFLGGVKLPDGDGFQAWYAQWDARIQIALVSRRNCLVEQHIRNGEFAGILDHVQDWVARWPADEVCHRHRIRLLLGLGQRDAALRAYEYCVAALAQHAGATPTVETRALVGLAQQPHRPGPSSPAVGEIQQPSWRPLAVLAIALGWRDDAAPDPEEAIAHMQAARRRVLDVLLSLGVWIPQPDDSTLLAYFGYPAGSERPVVLAAMAARLLVRSELDASIKLGIGVHADIALVGPGARPDLGGILSQKALALAWQAAHHEILLSRESVARLDAHEVQERRDRHGGAYLLERQRVDAQPPRMHGRSLEFDNLVHQWARLAPGRIPTSIQLSGPAGVGKSLLAQALVEYAEKTGGASIVLACEENGAKMPLRPLVSWLDDLVSARLKAAWRIGESGRDPDWPEARQFLQEALALTPEDAQELWNMGHTATMEHGLDAAQSAYKAAVSALTGRVRPSVPLLLVLENLHWADRATLELFEHLASRSYAGPVMILVTTRDLQDTRWVERHLSLAPLTRRAMVELVTARARAGRVARHTRMEIVAQSQGIPHYAIALLQQASSRHASGHAPRVSDLVCAWVNQGGRELRAVLIAAALCDGPIAIEQLQRVQDLSRARTENAVRQLRRMFLLTQEDGQVLCPILVRQAIVRMTSRAEREQVLERLARQVVSVTHDVW